MHTQIPDHRGVQRRTALTAAAALAVVALVAAALTTAPASADTPSGTPYVAASAQASAAQHAPVSPIRSRATASHARVVDHVVVTLVTGDRVGLSTWSDGRTSASLLPGSPSAGKPVQTMATASDTYVIPKLRAAVGARLDPSVFDISRLAALQQARGRVPVVIRFEPGVVPHSLPGIAVDRASATRTASGSTVARASYAGDATALGSASRSWNDVALVSLPSQPTAQRKDYVLHTLTVRALDRRGGPLRFGFAWVQNVEDSRLFSAPVFVVDGRVKVSVPEGPYSVMGGDFSWTVVKADFDVSDDAAVTLDRRDATVRPTIKVKGTILAELDLTLVRTAEKVGAFSWGVSGLNRLRLSPVPAHLPHGRLVTSLGGTLLPRSALHGGDITTARLVFTKDTRFGIPSTIALRHSKSDFAIVRHHYFANGPDRTSFLFMYAFTKYDNFAFILGLPITLGSSRTVWLQGGRPRTWYQSIDVFFKFSTFEYAFMDAPLQSYSPGLARPVQFLRGPVGPGYERGINADRTGGACLLCRDGNLLHGLMPLMSSAGTAMFGVVSGSSVASWRLSRGWRTLQRGTVAIYPRVQLPAAEHRYTLTAQSHPDLDKWRLSTSVSDTWGFSSAAGRAVVPLLIASYVPTNDVGGAGPRGRTTYRLDFDNLGPRAARVTKASLQYSVRVHSGWDSAKLTRLDANSFRVSYPNPFTRRHRFVSLRVQARDAAGRTVEETARNAYRATRPATHGPSSASSPRPTTPAAPVRGTGYPGHARHAIPACGPTKAREFRCFALIERRGSQALSKSGDPRGYNAVDLRDAYALDSLPASRQTVAVVVAYHYPSAESDMNRYRRKFGLPTCTSATGCFTKINQRGETANYPRRDYGWAIEAALDLQMISASCPTCHIILAEGNQPTVHSLNKATDAAVAAGAVVTNHSYGVQEFTGIRRSNRHYNAPGVTAVSSTGDYGYQPGQFPASSPDVIGAGGTVLRHALNARGWKERAWLYGGSGCSAYFAKPSFQTDPACGMRTSADLSAVADSIAIYDTFLPRRYRGWLTVAGTSVSSPLVAGMVAAAGAGGIKPESLYARPGAFHDIKKGLNGFCLGNYMCTAKPGYDGPTGLGTPRGLAGFGGAPTP